MQKSGHSYYVMVNTETGNHYVDFISYMYLFPYISTDLEKNSKQLVHKHKSHTGIKLADLIPSTV
jgi:hypothetical protein